MGRPVRYPEVPRWAQRLGVLLGTLTTLLVGVSFAFPARAETTSTIFTTLPYTAKTGQYMIAHTSSPPCPNGPYLYLSFSYASTSPFTIAEMHGETISAYATSTVLWVFDDFGHAWAATSTVPGSSPAYATTTWTFTEPYPSAGPGNGLTFQFAGATGLGIDVGTTIRFREYETGFFNQFQYCSGSGSSVTNLPTNIYGVPSMVWEGTASFAPPGTEGTTFPTSTYDGTFSDLLPTLGWGTGTYANTSTFFASKLDRFTSSQTDRFPMCIVYPWFQFLDSISGATGDGEYQTLVVGGGIAPTTTFSLATFDVVLAETGAGEAYTLFIEFLKGAAWLLLGVWIGRDIFAGRESDGTP